MAWVLWPSALPRQFLRVFYLNTVDNLILTEELAGNFVVDSESIWPNLSCTATIAIDQKVTQSTCRAMGGGMGRPGRTLLGGVVVGSEIKYC